MYSLVIDVIIKEGCYDKFLDGMDANLANIKKNVPGCIGIDFYCDLDTSIENLDESYSDLNFGAPRSRNFITIVQQWESLEALHGFFNSEYGINLTEGKKDFFDESKWQVKALKKVC